MNEANSLYLCMQVNLQSPYDLCGVNGSLSKYPKKQYGHLHLYNSGQALISYHDANCGYCCGRCRAINFSEKLTSRSMSLDMTRPSVRNQILPFPT